MLFFAMDLDTAEEFYDRAIYKEAVTEKERIAIMEGLIREGRIQVYGKTDYTKEEFIAAMSEYANVWTNRRKK